MNILFAYRIFSIEAYPKLVGYKAKTSNVQLQIAGTK
jgi:hypothetical protein